MTTERIMLVVALHAAEGRLETAGVQRIKGGWMRDDELRRQWERAQLRVDKARQTLTDYDAAHKEDAR